MHEDLERLDVIDAADRQCARLQYKIAGLKQAVVDAEARVQDAMATKAGAEAAVKDSQTNERSLSRTLEQHRGNQASAMRLLETGQGDPEAAERQVQRCTVLIDEVETEMLELLERHDGLSATLQAATDDLEEAEGALVVITRDTPNKIGALQAEIKALREKRNTQFAGLPREIASKYDHWRGRNKWAVSRMVDNACDACQMEIQAQHRSDLLRGLLAPCRRCHRWLIPPREAVPTK